MTVHSPAAAQATPQPCPSEIASTPLSPRTTFITAAASLLLFVTIFASIGWLTIKAKSPTLDEPVHLLAGYSYLKWGDYRVNPEHPPLAKLLAALPLMTMDLSDPRPTTPEWRQIPRQRPGLPTANVALEMFFVRNDAEAIFLRAKLPFLLLTLALGIAVFVWAKAWFGIEAGVAALLLFATNPNIIAHSTIIHTDIAFATWFFLASYFFHKTLAHGRWQWGVLACLSFALAAVTKFAALGLMLTWVALGLIYLFRRGAGPHGDAPESFVNKVSLLVVLFAGSWVAAYLAIWTVYGFRYDAIPNGLLSLPMAHVLRPDATLLKSVVSFCARNMLFPEAWLYGQLYTITNIHRTAYLLGETSPSGFWLYFPIALLVKTPLPTLLLCVFGFVELCRSRGERRGRLVLLWLPIIIYFSLAVAARMNIGMRHLMPIVPFLCVVGGASAARLWRAGQRWWRAIILLLLCWSLWGVWSIHPHYLAYFNELAGGAANGHKVLLDSNLEWGEDLKGLKRWMDRQRVAKVWLLYFGTSEPAYYGIDSLRVPGAILPPRLKPPATSSVPTLLAISANYFYGASIFATAEEMKFLQAQKLAEPIATIGHSILVFDLTRN